MKRYYSISATKFLKNNGEIQFQQVEDKLLNEVPVALVYNGISHTVMMCTPQNLADFALGFSLAEGILETTQELYGVDIVETCDGIEVQMEISTRRFVQLKERRRSMAGRTGCGICGVEQLAQVQRYKISDKTNRLQYVDPMILEECLIRLEQAQQLAKETGASHAAAFFTPSGELLALREDVGRHVALDKLLGWYAKQAQPEGFVFVTSRASFEMVQKCLACGVEMLCAISAATEMAVRLAQEHDFTLSAFTRKKGGTIYSGLKRLKSKI